MRHGDFALVGVAASVTLGDDGLIREARLAFAGAGDGPIRARKAESMLVGQNPHESIFREASLAATEDLDPVTDIHATGEYRRKVAAVIARRALVAAAEKASR